MITTTLEVITQYSQFIAMITVNGGITYLLWLSNRRTITVKDRVNRRITHIAR